MLDCFWLRIRISSRSRPPPANGFPITEALSRYLIFNSAQALAARSRFTSALVTVSQSSEICNPLPLLDRPTALANQRTLGRATEMGKDITYCSAPVVQEASLLHRVLGSLSSEMYRKHYDTMYRNSDYTPQCKILVCFYHP